MKTQTILVPTDVQDTSLPAVRYAFELAERLQATVYLLHVYPAAVVPDGAGSGYIPYDALHQRALERLSAHAEPFTGSPCMGKCLVALGEPSLVILEQARLLHADLIVVGTHAREGLPRVLIGSVAERVVRAADCPVVVVKQAKKPAERQESEALSC